MGSAVSNTVKITLPLLIEIQVGDDAGGDEGYIGAGNPVFLVPTGALIPSNATIAGYPINAVMVRTASGDESFELVLTGAPSGTVWALSFIDDIGHVWSFSNTSSGVSYINHSGYGFWIIPLPGPTFPALTVGNLYVINTGEAGSPVTAPVLFGLLNDLGNQILLTWTCATGGITAFTLYKNANNAGFALYQTFSGSLFQFLDLITEDPVDDIDSAAYYLVAQVGQIFSGPSNEVDNEVPNARI